MFWVENQNCSSAIGTLLDNQNITLAELLNQDDILHECKSQNKKLVEFLERPNVIEELIDLIIREPEDNDDPSNSYRRPTLASEIIACGLTGIIENMANDPNLLKKLYSFLDSKPPLNTLLASFFAKTCQVLVSRQCSQDWYSFQLVCLNVLEFFKNSNCLPKLLEHLGTSAIMDTLQCIIRIDVDDMKKDTLNWLDSQSLVEQLVNIICGKYKTEDVAVEVNSHADEVKSEDVEDVAVTSEETSVVEEKRDTENRLLVGQSSNAAQLMCNIIVNGRDTNSDCSNAVVNPLLKKCTSLSTVDFLLSSMFSSPLEARQIAIVNGVDILIVLLNDVPGSMKSPEIIEIASKILPYLPNFKDVITETPPKFKYGYSNSIEKPVGAARLAVVHLIEVLVCLDNSAIALAIMENNIISVLFDMFIEYKWNSFLHHFVVSIITKMCTTLTQKELYGKHLFIDCNILDKVIKAWEYNDISQKMLKPRHGYMGHLVQIANSLQEYMQQYPEVVDDLSAEIKDQWAALVDEKLEKVNAVQKLYLGGCHPSQSNNSAQHQQHSLQMGYVTYPANENYYVVDNDESESAYNEEPTNAEQMFISICNDMSGLEVNEKMMKLLIKDLSTSLVSELCHGEEESVDRQSSETIDPKILGLASQLSGCEPPKWLPSESRSDWDSNDINSSDILSSMTVNSSSTWGAVNNFDNDQVGWADFDKMDSVSSNRQSNLDAFNCGPYSTFSDLLFTPNYAEELFGDMAEDPFQKKSEMFNASLENAESTDQSSSSGMPDVTSCVIKEVLTNIDADASPETVALNKDDSSSLDVETSKDDLSSKLEEVSLQVVPPKQDNQISEDEGVNSPTACNSNPEQPVVVVVNNETHLQNATSDK